MHNCFNLLFVCLVNSDTNACLPPLQLAIDHHHHHHHAKRPLNWNAISVVEYVVVFVAVAAGQNVAYDADDGGGGGGVAACTVVDSVVKNV